ncbi:IclR family transcriptional regulator [Pelagibius litoralis]|uniref:IclR family transcriptional regulator n=1 Tax=Pelagibius litoralis TaxID=374515 RepID=A0A967C872_9PROT|nr:IclR family transcriptional regulator [Pelagibius litoralis]NIA68197.1 IclR family transcriptional regulator [Pelagibius litoralis]
MANTSQSLERGLSILELLEAEAGPLGIREMARRLQLSPAIVQRLVTTLDESHFVTKDADTRKYRLGYRALSLGSSMLSDDNLIAASMPVLAHLTREMEVNAFLAVISGDRLVYILALQSNGPISIRSAPGTEAAFHATAMGKAMLADESDARARSLLGAGPLAALTERTMTDPDKVIAELAAVREQGYATSLEENLVGVVSTGASVKNASGRSIAAISIAYVPSLQPKIPLADAINRIMTSAAEISRRLGCPEDCLNKIQLIEVADNDVA